MQAGILHNFLNLSKRSEVLVCFSMQWFIPFQTAFSLWRVAGEAAALQCLETPLFPAASDSPASSTTRRHHASWELQPRYLVFGPGA